MAIASRGLLLHGIYNPLVELEDLSVQPECEHIDPQSKWVISIQKRDLSLSLILP